MKGEHNLLPLEKGVQRIELLPLQGLIPYARNSRTHSDAQAAQIAASIHEFGFTNPVLIDAEGGIIAGHGRVQAARLLGMDAVPCIRLPHLSEAQRRAYVIADNRLALNAGWDEEMLRIELADLQEADFDLSLLGFEDGELSGLLSTADEAQLPELPDGDRAPFQQMTFTLHDEQVQQVEAAMAAARAMGPFVDSPNENGNGNALARVCEVFLTQHGGGR